MVFFKSSITTRCDACSVRNQAQLNLADVVQLTNLRVIDSVKDFNAKRCCLIELCDSDVSKQLTYRDF